MNTPPPQILVVDDDQDIRETLGEILRDEGYRVVCASDGQEALDALRSGMQFSLVLLDLMMPHKDGWEFRREQQADPAIAHVPVVVVTASGKVNGSLGAVEAILQKPLRFTQLQETLRRHCPL